MNMSTLDRNIADALDAAPDALAPRIKDAFWRFRDRHDSCCAERLAWLFADWTALHDIAASVVLSRLPVRHEPGQALRVMIELDDFMRERIVHGETICICRSPV